MYDVDASVHVIDDDKDLFESWINGCLSVAYETLGISASPETQCLFKFWVMQMLHPNPTRRPTVGEVLFQLTEVFEMKMEEKDAA
jgi:hypothetical protein